MKIGWVCLEGTNDWDSVSTLGTNIIIRIPIFDRLHDRGDTLEWFGLKKNSHTLEGDDLPYFINPHYDLANLVKSYIRGYKNEWDSGKVKNPHKYSMSKWVAQRTIRSSLRYLSRNPLPKIDALFMEYMDNGWEQIVFFSVVLLHYQEADIPIYVRDTEHKFRYISELKRLHDSPRENTYSHRLGRYLTDPQIESLRGKIRMVYAWDDPTWDDGTDGFYRTPSISLPVIYDPKRELSLSKIKKIDDVVYIGNDNDRRPMFEKYYGKLKYNANIYGNWNRRAQDFVAHMREVNKKVHFQEPIKQDIMLQVLSHSYCTVFVTKEIYKKVGQVTDRAVEVSLAGTLAVTPTEMKNADLWTLPEYIVRDPKMMNQKIGEIKGLSNNEYRLAVEAQRSIIREHYDADYVFYDLLEILAEDGVKI